MERLDGPGPIATERETHERLVASQLWARAAARGGQQIVDVHRVPLLRAECGGDREVCHPPQDDCGRVGPPIDLEVEIVKGDESGDEPPCVGDEIEVSEENFVAFRKMQVPRIMVSCIYQLIDKQPQVWSVGVRMKVKEVAAESVAPPIPPVEMWC